MSFIPRRRLAWILVFASLAAAIALAMPGCSSKSSGAALAAGCTLNSDCNNPLVCIFALCHQACQESRDCPQNEACVKQNGNGVCQLPSEANCVPNGAACEGTLVCGQDDKCRAPCASLSDCLADQQCTKGVCYDPGELDGGASSSSGGSSGGSSGSSSGGSSGGSSGSSSGGDGACTPPVGDAGVLGYIPSNFNPASLDLADGGLLPEGGVTFVNAPDVTINGSCGSVNAGAGGLCPSIPPAATISLSDSTQADLVIMHNFTVESGATLVLNGCSYPRPLIFAVLGAADIQGIINVAASGQFPGPGGFPPCEAVNPLGPGGGGVGFSTNYLTSAPGGGSYCGGGGNGSGTGTLAPGGNPYGLATVIPLAAGSAGGNLSPGSGYVAASGGALQISAGQSLFVRNAGSINAGGGANYGAGGAGGAILLEAPTVTVDGILTANGGSGGDSALEGNPANPSAVPAVGASGGSANPTYGTGGNGAAGATVNGSNGVLPDGGSTMNAGAGGGAVGYIRINSFCPASIGANAILSPSMTPATTCTTTGTLTY
jgi:hypothetical protein